MGNPVLTTKLYALSIRPGLVPRPRLIQRLNEGRPGQRGDFDRKLTLISAPAGFGKTTLVGDWLYREDEALPPLHVAWLSLDEGDNDAARFLTYVVAALQTVEGGLGQTTISLLQSPQATAIPPLENIITLLLNDLAALSVQVTLVLDDYHVIDNLEIHEALAFLLDNSPPQLHLVVVSREDPMLPLHRLRARGQMVDGQAISVSVGRIASGRGGR
jgi:LuxR family maltose regulon positive regulatory protein